MLSLLAAGCASYPEAIPALADARSVGTQQGANRAEFVIDASERLAPDALAAIAVLTNADLIAMRARLGVADAQVFSAGLYPDPVFTVGADFASGVPGLVTALATSLGTDVAALAARPVAVRQAQANRASVVGEVAWAEWLTGEQARLLGTRVAYLEQAKSLTAAYRTLAEANLAAVLAAARRGDLSADSLEAARLAATDAGQRDRAAEQDLTQARLDLNALLNLPPGTEVGVTAPGPLPETVPAASSLFELASARRSDLGGLRAGYEEQDAAMRAAALKNFPLPAIGVNAGRDTGGVKTIGPAISMTLPIFSGGKGDAAVARATAAQLRAEYEARLAAIQADIASARAAYTLFLSQRQVLLDDIAPLADQSTAARRAADRGDVSRAQASALAATLIDRQILATGLEQAAAEAVLALEIASGGPLVETGR